MTCLPLSRALCCWYPVALALCVTTAAAVDVEVLHANPYQFHLAQSPAPSLRLTSWMQPQAMPSRLDSLGLSLDLPSEPPSQFPASPPQPLVLDLGVRWRSQLGSRLHLEFSAWGQSALPFARDNTAHDAMGMIRQREITGYGTRVEVQWSNAPTRGLLPENGAIGMQLQRGSRVVLRAKRGGPMVYFRSKF